MRPTLFAVVAVAALATGTVVAAQKGPPVAPAASDLRLGALRLSGLRDAAFQAPNDGSVFQAPGGPAAIASLLKSRGLPTGSIPLSVDGLLVRGLPGHIVLIDTGNGAKKGGVLAGSLAAAGVKPAQVTDVLITHSHGDHVGGLVGADGKPAFPNATIRMSAPEWAFMQSQAQTKPIAAAVQGQLKTFAPGAAVIPGITAVALPGHTPGHSGYRIVSRGVSLLDVGDISHSSVVSLARPDWNIQFDNDKTAGRQTRIRELRQLAASRQLIFAPHFPYSGFGRVVPRGSGYAWVPATR
ncbi:MULTISPECIES: MBL fold metallo-hydrolase [Sphingomonas]|uniref:MBL fold metallo-hydrolase n=1 Tax=Sphingomonas TaxID=13687 RepID=UPI000DEF986D|nr:MULTISPECIES: MBL fold metallo-hydrolase [Sphingomonas]